MTILQKFEYTWPEGADQIEMYDWLKTLPQSEQDEFAEGQRNGERLRQIAIDDGRMIVRADGNYEWRDAEAFAVGKQNDPIWQKYWKRWQVETGVIFSIKYE
jgi:hypothetical protein